MTLALNQLARVAVRNAHARELLNSLTLADKTVPGTVEYAGLSNYLIDLPPTAFALHQLRYQTRGMVKVDFRWTVSLMSGGYFVTAILY